MSVALLWSSLTLASGDSQTACAEFVSEEVDMITQKAEGHPASPSASQIAKECASYTSRIWPMTSPCSCTSSVAQHVLDWHWWIAPYNLSNITRESTTEDGSVGHDTCKRRTQHVTRHWIHRSDWAQRRRACTLQGSLCVSSCWVRPSSRQASATRSIHRTRHLTVRTET